MLFTSDINNKWINCIQILTAESSALAPNISCRRCRLNASVGRCCYFSNKVAPSSGFSKLLRSTWQACDIICLLSNYAMSKYSGENKACSDHSHSMFSLEMMILKEKMFKHQFYFISIVHLWEKYTLLW